MRLKFLLFALTLLLPNFVTADELSWGAGASVSPSAIIREMNLARQNPGLYATYLEESRLSYSLGSVDEALRFLRSTRPLPPLVISPGLCKSAADHCADQAGGRLGHGNPARRMQRYGMWGSAWAENISYGKTTAREIIMQLIVDDGQPARKHRKNIFSPNFNYAGAAFGTHARYRSVCNIDFAGTYTERGAAIIARNY